MTSKETPGFIPLDLRLETIRLAKRYLELDPKSVVARMLLSFLRADDTLVQATHERRPPEH